MKTTSFFSLVFLMFLAAKPLLPLHSSAPVPPSTVWSEGTLNAETVYYFLVAQCSDCAPGEGRTAGKYVIVTPGIERAEYTDHYQLLEKFRANLAAKYPNSPALRDGLEFRFEFTRGDAEKFRQTELVQKRAAGYEVLELDVTQ